MQNTGHKRAAQLVQAALRTTHFLNKYRFLETKLRLELLCTFESIAANMNGLGKTYETKKKLRDILNIKCTFTVQP